MDSSTSPGICLTYEDEQRPLSISSDDILTPSTLKEGMDISEESRIRLTGTSVADDKLPSMQRVKQPSVFNTENKLWRKGLTELQINNCLSCINPVDSGSCDHPLFEGKLCSSCKDDLMEGFFAIDVDGSSRCCSVCGRHGKLAVCDSKNCGRAYCFRCIGNHLGLDFMMKYVEDDTYWVCFLCTPYSKATHGILQPLSDWEKRIVDFFNPVQVEAIYHGQISRQKGGVRVLSLADGICAVKVALENLDVEIEDYYRSDINPKAEKVSLKFGNNITQLGDLTELDVDKLQQISPVDLVIAAPPVVSRCKKDYPGREQLLMHAIDIIQQLQMLQSDERTLYWLLETSVYLETETRKEVSQTLMMEPAMWNAQFFTPVQIPKLYWSNIPGLYGARSYYEEHGNQSDLCKYLVQYHNEKREALVSHIRPEVLVGLPTSIPEDIRDLYKNVHDPTNFCLPVSMNGLKSELWIEELDKLMGFPVHHTDVKLKRGERLKLLANSSCVHVLQHLLSPLKYIYTE